MRQKILIIFVLFFWSILTSSNVFAHEGHDHTTLPETYVNPDKYLFYSVKRLIEKGTVYTKFSKESKADYYMDLTLIRLAELKYVIGKDIVSDIEHSSERLSYQVGILSDYIVANKTDLESKKVSVIARFNRYKELLVPLRDKYPANSSYWMLVQHDINSIDINLEKLKY